MKRSSRILVLHWQRFLPEQVAAGMALLQQLQPSRSLCRFAVQDEIFWK